MGIIPAGSGNGLASVLGIPCDARSAIGIINQYRITEIDTINVNKKMFVSIAGIGFDALVLRTFAPRAKRGLLSYLQIILREYFFFKPEDYALVADGKEYRQRAFLIAFANSRQYGHKAHIAPGALIDDGLLYVCFMNAFPPVAAPIIGFRLFHESIGKSRYVYIVQCRKVEVIGKAPFLLHLDGEPTVMGNRLYIEVNPLSLSVITGIRSGGCR